MTDTSTSKDNKKLTWWILGIIFVLIAVGIIWYIIHSRRYPSTDDAYVQAHIINIAPQVSGPVVNVFVKNHQHIKQGQLLFSINPLPYQYAVQKAEAQLTLAQEQGQRFFPLIKEEKEAPAEGDKIKAQIGEAQAALGKAQYDLAHTIVKAPEAGIIANFTIRRGDTVTQGIDLFAIVEQYKFWVDANFKETQLQNIKIGQTANIKVDMYPDEKFNGVIQSISPGSGTIFSLLPPENATGNWVKVTQRIPVKIAIINPNTKYPLIAGTSARVTVDTISPVKSNG